MTLQDISKRYYELLKSYQKELDTVINSGCEKLIIMLNALKGKYPFPQIEDEYGFAKDNTWAINFRYISRVGIRYCGQFINMMIISKNETLEASERIRLDYASYENNDYKYECYPDDMYFGEAADCRYKEFTIQYDWENFWNLVCQLKTFFDNTNIRNIYKLMLEEISEESRKLSKIEDDINVLIGEELEFYMREVFKRKDRYNEKNNKHLILLPNNISIRYKGKFHNCLILDNYAFSLGYLQSQEFIAEECYYQDPYTTANDFNRYIQGERKLLHEVSFNNFHNGFNEVKKSLDDLIFICGNDFENLQSCQYLGPNDYVYPKGYLVD